MDNDKKMVKALIYTRQFRTCECIKDINIIIQKARKVGLIPQLDEVSGSNVAFKLWLKIYKVYDINEEQKYRDLGGNVDIKIEQKFFESLPERIREKTCENINSGYGG